MGEASMAAMGGVAGATGRAARPESHTPARPQWADAAASTAAAPWVLVGRPRWGARKRGQSRRRAPSRLSINLVGVVLHEHLRPQVVEVAVAQPFALHDRDLHVTPRIEDRGAHSPYRPIGTRRRSPATA